MIDQERNDQGKFIKKGNLERKTRCIRLSDKTWSLLEEKAQENDMTRADFLESLASGEIDWDEEKEVESELDFDVEEVAEILKEALNLKSNAGGKIKAEIKKVLKLMDVELEDK